MERSIDSVVGAFGILKAGASYVPIDSFCPPGRLSYILNKCRIRHLLTSKEKLAALALVLPSIVSVERILVLNGLGTGQGPVPSDRVVDWKAISGTVSDSVPEAPTIDTDIAYILFTSGSTGNPKGVMLSHLNALTFINAAYDLFGITAQDRLSNICPLHFDMSVFDLFVAMKAGATMVIIPETTTTFPVKLAEVIEKNKITVWNSVPSALSLLAAYAGLESHDLSSLRLVLFAGERFPLKYLKRLMEIIPAARFCNMYGQTEANTSTYYWIEQPPPDDHAALPIGRALPNFEVFALNDEGKRITGPGQEGELYVRASTVARGYWDEAEKTEKAFVPNPLRPDLKERVYRTGDLVELDADANYVFQGRKDHMIKSRGYRIEIGEIEAILRNHREVKNAVVIPIPDELIGNRISAIIVPMAPGSITREELMQYCSRQLPKYMLPEIVEFRDDLPTTSSGKIDRQQLRVLNGMTGHAGNFSAAK
jgi:amino acid adenylation domain-containing protein